MIRGVNSGNGVQVSGGYVSWPQFYNSIGSTGNSLIGQVRYNGSSQCMEVYDGNTWLTMPPSYPTVELTPDVQSVVNWARSKMAEEAHIRELAARHPSVADALEAVKRAEEQVRVVAALVDNV